MTQQDEPTLGNIRHLGHDKYVYRRTLKYISNYPTPNELYEKLLASHGFPYKTDRENYLIRDRALVSLLYIAAVRISEALRLKRSQFVIKDKEIELHAIQLSKARHKVCMLCGLAPRKEERREHLIEAHPEVNPDDLGKYFVDKPRHDLSRDVAYIPLGGERGPLGHLIADYLLRLNKDERLFSFGPKHAWRITVSLVGYPNHHLRAFGENYFYEQSGFDFLAVADFMRVDARTLSSYIHRGKKVPHV